LSSTQGSLLHPAIVDVPRRVEHETLSVPIRRVQSVEEDCVNVRVTAEVAVGALDDGNRAVLAAGNASIRQAHAVVGRHGVDEDAQDLAQEFPVEGQGKSQRERHRDHKLSQGHIGQNVVQQIQGASIHTPAATAWTEPATLAAPAHNKALVAGGAEKLCKASRQDSTP
jgi:hypothetical protein